MQENYKHDFTATEMNGFIIFTEKITVFTKLVKTEGKSGLLLIWYSLIGLFLDLAFVNPYTNNPLYICNTDKGTLTWKHYWVIQMWEVFAAYPFFFFL